MPRNVRNFWLNLAVDGKKERVATGPRNSGGGFSLSLCIRNKGAVDDAGVLLGRCVNGKLELTYTNTLGQETILATSDR